ncbi:phosphoenolpyruvate-protein phosphotransferase PtsI [Buchnera aphidicola]|uniref:phosphoenolpyruvate-protein phosphotransferase PtsI n=1 Tax=Buchnera aphidicola TaxID=9 RepID=UPI003463D717
MISGILASPGIAFGKALILKKSTIKICKKNILHKNIDQEITKFIEAKKKTIVQIQNIQKKSKIILKNEEISIFEGHIMILEDIEFEKDIIELIKNTLCTADFAIQKVISKQIQKIKNIPNEYLKNRAIDIQDIGDRLLKNILNINIINLKEIQEDIILVAKDLTPSETAQMNFKYIKGFITDLGGETSHTSIIARSLEIPAIVGTENCTKKIKNGDFLILNAIDNQIFINPKQQTINSIQKNQDQYLKKKKKLTQLKKLPAITIDNHKIEISANISNINDISNAKKYGAESIGLYRTEFLFMERNQLPSEEEQFLAYKEVATKMQNKPINIRTMDIGGDKEIPYMNFPKEENPFLGWRAIRISIDKKEILETQLKAILRASAFGKIRILFPMIISVEEIQILKEAIEKMKHVLNKKKILFDKNIEIGIMIETPSAAIIAKYLIKEVDFFSIGTNDLTQYTLAVDRGNKLIAHLYNPMSPAILTLIKNIIEASHQANKWTGMCGELASYELATILLIGMGLDEFSMNPSCIPKIKKIIRKITFQDAYQLSKMILKQPTTEKIIKLLNENIYNK